MSRSLVIPMTTLVTVSGTPNVYTADTVTANFWLRRYDDASSTYQEQFAGVDLGSGEFQFDVPEGNYQLWKSAYPDLTSGNRIDKWHGGAAKYRRITDEDEGNYIRTDGTRAFTGDQSMGSKKLTNLDASSPAGTDAINKDYVVSNFVGLNEKIFLSAGNTLLVDYAATNLTGVRYNTIQGAIDYAQGQTPTGAERWTIYIIPHKNNGSHTGYVEAITLYKHIDLVGLGMVMCKVTFAYGVSFTGGQYCKLQNLYVRPADDGGLTLRGLECYNCIFTITGDNATPNMALENSKFLRCGFFIHGRTAPTTMSSTDNNQIIECFSNEDLPGTTDIEVGNSLLDDDTFDFTFI